MTTVLLLKSLALVLALLVLGTLALGAYGASLWSRATSDLIVRLNATRTPLRQVRFDPATLIELPLPVQRYFRAALASGQPLVAAADCTHTGSFNASDGDVRWSRFRSIQHVVVSRPGFVWSARIAMWPGVQVCVHDAYVAGEGLLHAALFGLFSVADMRGGSDLARGELLRFFAEAAWYPTALLPGEHLQWSAVDTRTARAVLDDGGTRVELTFIFGNDDLIDTVRAEARGRIVGNRTEHLPWEGRFWNYVERGGMTIPLDGEVAWLTPEGRKPYWRGTIQTISHEFAR